MGFESMHAPKPIPIPTFPLKGKEEKRLASGGEARTFGGLAFARFLRSIVKMGHFCAVLLHAALPVS